MPSFATLLKPSSSKSLGTPNQLHSGTAAIFGDTTGYASAVPPPFLAIDASAAFRPALATPLRRYRRSTKKHVILQSLPATLGAARL